jgi:hypothetical protein
MTVSIADELTVSTAKSIREGGVESPVGLIPISCVYCWEPIPSESFVYWSKAKRMLSVACPCCDRRVTLSTAVWRQWSGLAAEPGG